MSEKELEDLAEYLGHRVAQGFDDLELIVDAAVEYFADEGIGDVRTTAERLARDLLAEHLRDQRTWVGDTDCDRLTRAFAALERQGIVARQNFTCCQSCGHAEIGDEIEAAEEGGPVRGYVFYHMQDTEAAEEHGNLFLAYGSNGGGDAEALAIGRAIVAALEAAGLRGEWSGELTKRIQVTPLVWRRRRTDPEARIE